MSSFFSFVCVSKNFLVCSFNCASFNSYSFDIEFNFWSFSSKAFSKDLTFISLVVERLLYFLSKSINLSS